MGSDLGPGEIIKGALLATSKLQIEPVFVGDQGQIKSALKAMDKSPDEFEILGSSSVIENNEEPVKAIRKKKDSSMVMGLTSLSQTDDYQGFISCGSTGALLAGGIFIVKRLDQVKRPPISAIVPTMTDPILLMDAGANMDLNPSALVQFALMAHTYMQKIQDIKEPKIGLLNIGSEEGKGNKLTKEAYDLLKERNDINFVGNIESSQVPFGGVDVLICDGFAGNILLKTYEGSAKMFMQIFKSSVKNIKNPIALMSIKKQFSGLSSLLDYSKYGGAPLLGLKKPVFKAHGNSDAQAIVGASQQILRYIDTEIIKTMEDSLDKVEENE